MSSIMDDDGIAITLSLLLLPQVVFLTVHPVYFHVLALTVETNLHILPGYAFAGNPCFGAKLQFHKLT